MGAKKIERQTRMVHEGYLRGFGPYKVHSITREEIPLTSRYVRVQSVSELNQGDIYYLRGLNGRLSHSCVFDIEDPCINYLKIVESQVRREAVFIEKKKEEKVKKKNKDNGTISLF